MSVDLLLNLEVKLFGEAQLGVYGGSGNLILSQKYLSGLQKCTFQVTSPWLVVRCSLSERKQKQGSYHLLQKEGGAMGQQFKHGNLLLFVYLGLCSKRCWYYKALFT